MNATNQSFESIDVELEKLLDPSSSSFALLGDELAMSRYEIGTIFVIRLSIYREFLSTEYNYIRDLQTMSDVFEFYSKCKKENITPIIGCEIYARRDNDEKKYHHLVLIAKNKKGLKNLLKILKLLTGRISYLKSWI